jgi:hypothetical protein
VAGLFCVNFWLINNEYILLVDIVYYYMQMKFFS